jgi:putative transposase
MGCDRARKQANSRTFLANKSKERNMFVAEKFIGGLVKSHGQHPISTDGGTWYPQACKFLKLKHHLHSHIEKSLIERTMQYIKDRTEQKVLMITFLVEKRIVI